MDPRVPDLIARDQTARPRDSTALLGNTYQSHVTPHVGAYQELRECGQTDNAKQFISQQIILLFKYLRSREKVPGPMGGPVLIT